MAAVAASKGGNEELKGVGYYAGAWKSGFYPQFIASGRVAAEVNFDKKLVKFVMVYDGQFRKGFKKVMETKLDSEGKSGQADLYVFDVKALPGHKQSLKFRASVVTHTQVVGTYESSQPDDNGTYQMQNISQQEFNTLLSTDTPPPTNSCIIA